MKNYQIINHGWDNSQYFQGCGVAYTKFTDAVTGGGMDAVEAYADALEQVYQGSDYADAIKLPRRPRGYGINRKNKVPAYQRGEDSDCYYYVSIRYRSPVREDGV